jgi:GDP-D-mannose 3',5'-epimerase
MHPKLFSLQLYVSEVEGISTMKNALVLGAGGFIGSHMCARLKKDGYFVRGVDLKVPEFDDTSCDEFIIGDLTDFSFTMKILQLNSSENDTFDEVYQYAADMGGAGYIFTGSNDASIMYNSAQINLNVLEAQRQINQQFGANKTKIFYSSSACVYPEYNQLDADSPICSEDSAYPAAPDSEYGWEKLFSERLFLAYNKNHNISVAVARFHNIYGPKGTWKGGREKAPAAICRKIASVGNDAEIEIWGDGNQTRSFLYIDDCIEATRRLMENTFVGPINIGSEEMVTINHLVEMVARIAKKDIKVKHIDGPLGVRGRNSDNYLIRKTLNWDYEISLAQGLTYTYQWIEHEMRVESGNGEKV